MGFFSGIKKVVSKVASPVVGAATGYLSGGWKGALSGGLDAFGSAVSAQQAYNQTKEGARRQNKWASNEAGRQMNFQKGSQLRAFDYQDASTARQMAFQSAAAKTAHLRNIHAYKNRYKWQMQDMQRAGLNPILAYQTGAGGLPGASAPAGASSSASGQPGAAAPVVNEDAHALAAVNSAYENARKGTEQKVMRETMKRLQQEVKTGAATEENVKIDTNFKKQQTQESWARQTNLMELNDKMKAETAIIKENLTSAKAAAAAAKTDKAFWESDLGKALRKIDKAGQAINPFASASQKTSSIFR